MDALKILTELNQRLVFVSTDTSTAATIDAKGLRDWLLAGGLESLKPLLVTYLESKLLPVETKVPIVETKTIGEQLAARYANHELLEGLVFTDKRLISKIEAQHNIKGPIKEYDNDMIAWIAAYLAGLGITPAQFKMGLSDFDIATIAIGFSGNYEESESDMFIVGVTNTALGRDSEIAARWANGKRFRLDLSDNFGDRINKYNIVQFAYFVAGTGDTDIDNVKRLEHLLALYNKLPSQPGSEILNSFIAGFAHEA